ncbi:MAG: hypothetical protein AB8B80_01930 [Marinicellaceae bacterium]
MRYLILQNKKNRYCYKIADTFCFSDTLINGLEYLLQAHCQLGQLDKSQSHLSKSSFNSSEYSTIYDQLTPIGENNYPLKVHHNKFGNYKVQTEQDEFYISDNTIYAKIKNIDITILMGPVFILQLSKNNVFCLHASAFVIDKKCYILMADSGTGKSTIARYMQQKNLGTRVADDIVPVKIIDGKILILANFPQLKLNQNQQYLGENIILPTVLLFARKSKKPTDLVRMNSFESIKHLIYHSVATKLFQESELQNHLQFCHQVSQQALAFGLNYEHNKKSLMALKELLDEV